MRLDGRAHDLPHVQLRPGGDIAAEAEAQARCAHFLQSEDAAAEEKIRRRAMCHAGPSGGDGFALAVAEVQAVAEHGARGEEAAFLIHIRVVERGGKLVPHLFDLLEVFREVRLDVGAVFRRQFADGAHEFFATCHGEARAERILQQPAARAVPGLAEPLAFVERDGRDLRRLEVSVAAHVHHHFPHDDAQPAGCGGVKSGLARVLEDRGIEHRGGRAVAREFRKKRACFAAAFRAGEFALQWENVLPQPGEQVAAAARDRRVLRDVGVEVDEAGENRRAWRVPPAHGLLARLAGKRGVVADLGDESAVDDQCAVAPRAEAAKLGGIDEKTADAEQRGVGIHRAERVDMARRLARRGKRVNEAITTKGIRAAHAEETHKIQRARPGLIPLNSHLRP